ncbi:hypothetical protein AAFF_G00043020 [Aldrovandia affinis]|uniref:ILEI/PANDER domain-containing protein n=1 Tax=Aldrovandia affinis TaxID=143900 RepID=A0AAD7S2T7_9TELE|nr:hypothetical protein AAFF_G00043020 [Aldrovandia affinis]
MRYQITVNTRIVIMTTCCITGWFLGQFLAHVLPPKHIIAVVKDIKQVSVIKPKAVPPPKRQKCNRWSTCPNGEFAFQIMSGGGTKRFPKICFEDYIILGEMNAGRGINIAAVNASSGKAIDVATFDMWSGDNSEALVKFIQKIPSSSYVLMATFDEGSTNLKPQAKKEIENLGSTLINKIAFRANWIFLGAKGVTIPSEFKKEKILFANQKWNKYPGWPSEIQIDGCVGRR